MRYLAAIAAMMLAADVSIGFQAQPPARPPAQRPGTTPPAPVSEIQKAIEEFRVQTRNLGLREDSPAKARQAGAKMQWHGRVFENFRNDFLDAVPHEVAQRGGTKNILRRNQFGFNVAGPVLIPRLYKSDGKTFFSFTFEGMREKVGRSFLRTIPTMQERTGDWGHVVDLAGQQLPVYDPATTAENAAYDPRRAVSAENPQYNRSPFPNNRIPASRLDREAQRLIQFYPAPNSDAGPFFRNNYFIFSPEINTANGAIARVDHTVRERHRLGFGLNYSNGLDGSAPWFPTAADPNNPPRTRNNRRATLEHVFTLSPNSVNTITFDVSTDQIRNLPKLDENGRPFASYRMQPYLSMGTPYPESRNARNSFVLTDGYSTRWREHRVRLIGQVVREQVNSFTPQYPSGRYTFSPGLTSLPGIVNTGHAFASFLLGAADFAEQSLVISPSYFRRNRFLVALRDQWEVKRGFTLSFGLNLETSTPRTERYNRMSTVSFAEINPVNQRPGAMIVAGQAGRGRAFQPVLFRGEPSMGFAWTLPKVKRSVMRAGYGRSYSAIPVYSTQWGTQAFNGQPAWVSPNVQLIPAVVLSQGLPPARTFPDLRPESANNTIADLVEPAGRQPTYQSASLSLESELGASVTVTVSAAHSEGKNLLLSNSGSNPNAISLSALQFRDRLNDEQFNRSLRPFPHYQRFEVYSSWPEGKYTRDACGVRVEKRTSGGLSMSAYYEFSKQMDNYSGPYGIQDYYNRKNEWSLTSSNNPHRLSLTYMYELPFGQNKMFFNSPDWKRHLVGGWSLSGVTTVASGEPIALRPQFNNTGGVVDALNVNLVPGVSPHVENRGPELWFNPAAFAQPADFTTGDASRTHPQLRNPLNQNHDLSVNKRFPVTQETSMEFSMVGLNFINRADWTEPDTVIGPASAPNVNAGRIIGSRGGRVIQLGLRFNF
ncbi:MAG: hypothetical protein JNL98_33475 [Bryobacterales bacterium]|nr:hypothetical protein [Bryobacterales bacterium]